MSASYNYNVYYTYATTYHKCGDDTRYFETKAEAWSFVKAVRDRAAKTGTHVDLVVYGRFDRKLERAPMLYELSV